MKISLNTDSADMLIKARQNSGLTINQLLKEAMQLLLVKYNNEQVHNDQTNKNSTRLT